MNQLTKMFDDQDLTIIESGGEPFFLLNDVCNILDLTNSRRVKERLDKDVTASYPLETSGGTQQVTFINEDGLYDVILDSRKPEAKRFRKWITSEVIPSIRKHGAYMTPEKIEDALLNPDTIIQLATDLKSERAEREKIEQQQKQDKPFTKFGKAVSNSDAAINVGAFAKMIYDEHGIKIGRNKLFAWLRDNGYLIKSGREWNQPKQEYIEQGLFDTSVTVVTHNTKGNMQHVTPLVTGKGQIKFTEILLDDFGVIQ